MDGECKGQGSSGLCAMEFCFVCILGVHTHAQKLVCVRDDLPTTHAGIDRRLTRPPHAPINNAHRHTPTTTGQFHVGVQEEVIQELTRFEDVAYNYLECVTLRVLGDDWGARVTKRKR